MRSSSKAWNCRSFWNATKCAQNVKLSKIHNFNLDKKCSWNTHTSKTWNCRADWLERAQNMKLSHIFGDHLCAQRNVEFYLGKLMFLSLTGSKREAVTQNGHNTKRHPKRETVAKAGSKSCSKHKLPLIVPDKNVLKTWNCQQKRVSCTSDCDRNFMLVSSKRETVKKMEANPWKMTRYVFP